MLVEDKMLTAEATLTLLNEKMEHKKKNKQKNSKVNKTELKNGEFFCNTCQLLLWALWRPIPVFGLLNWLDGLLRLPISYLGPKKVWFSFNDLKIDKIDKIEETDEIVEIDKLEDVDIKDKSDNFI